MSSWYTAQAGPPRRWRLGRATLALCVLAALLALPAALSAAEALPIAPGVTVEELRDAAGPWEIRVLRIERVEQQVHLLTALGAGQLSGVEPLTRIVARESDAGKQVVAAINADFFRMSNRPFPGGLSGPCVRDGELITTPRGRSGFYLTADAAPRIEVAQTTGQVLVGGEAYRLGGMNMPDQGAEGSVQLFTATGGWELSDGCLVATLEGGPLRSQGRWEAVVTEVAAPGTARAAQAGEVLIAALDEQVRSALLGAATGDRVEITLQTEPFTEPVLQAVGGNPLLVRAGEIVGADRVRHPRTAAGYNDREIILVTVDGRQPGWSVGMTMTELAALMHRLGCTEAVNLDGGGSTTAWVRGRIINRPSGGRQRSIANGLLLVSTAPTGGPARLQASPTSAVMLSGAELPLKLAVADAWYNPLEFEPEAIGATVVEQAGDATIAVNMQESRLSVTGGPGRATVKLALRDQPEVAATVEVEVVAQCAAFELSPVELRLPVGSSGAIVARGFTAEGAEVVLRPGAVAWRVTGGGVQHLGDGRFRADAAGARADVTATLGGVEAQAQVRATTEVAVEDFSADPQVSFSAIPDTVSGQLSVLAEEREGHPISFCRMTYDLGEATRTRVAYMELNRPLGEALGVSLLARTEGSTAWVRVMLIDAAGARHLLTAAEALAPTEGWKRLTVAFPADLPGPLVLRSVYVAATTGMTGRGTLDVADVRALVVPGG